MREILGYTTYFEAVDRKVFETKEECLQYERFLAVEAAEKITKKLPHFYCFPEWLDRDYTWEWYFVSSQEELNAVRTVLYNPDAVAHEYEATSFPCWLAFSYDDAGNGLVEGSKDQVIDSLEAFKFEINKKIMDESDGIKVVKTTEI